MTTAGVGKTTLRASSWIPIRTTKALRVTSYPAALVELMELAERVVRPVALAEQRAEPAERLVVLAEQRVEPAAV